MANKLIDTNGLKAFWNKLKAYTATTSRNGLMSATDKGKTDRLFMTEADSYSRISKYISKSSYVTKIEAYPIAKFGEGTEILYYIKVTTNKHCFITVLASGLTSPIIVLPTLMSSSSGEYWAAFTYVFPSSAAGTIHENLIAIAAE